MTNHSPSWFPACLLVVDHMLQSQKVRWQPIAIVVFFFTLQILAGYLQYAAYAILFTGLYYMARAVSYARSDKKRVFRVGVSLLLAVLMAGILAFPQLNLTYELVLLSNRAAPEPGYAYVGSYSPLALICMFFPSLESLFISKLYLGILPIFFMAYAFSHFKRKNELTFIGLTLIAFLLALGKYSPLYVVIVELFDFHSFRTPIKFLYFAGFFLSVLCALGWQAFLTEEDGKRQKVIIKRYLWGIIGVVTLTLSAYLAFRLFEKPLTQLGEWLVMKWVYDQPGHPYSAEFYQSKLIRYIQSAQKLLNPMNVVIWLPIVKMSAAAALLWSWIRRRLGLRLFCSIAFALLIVDLNFTYSDIRGDYESYESFFRRNKMTQFLESNLGDARYFIYSEQPDQAPLPASKNIIYNLATVNAYSPLIGNKYYNYFGSLGGINDSNGYHALAEGAIYTHLNLLRNLNVKYIMTDRNLEFPEILKVLQEGPWTLYEIQDTWPLFRTVSQTVTVKNLSDLREEIAGHPEADKIAFLDFVPKIAIHTGSIDQGAMIDIIKRSDQEIRLHLELPEAKYLIAAIHYDPHWTLTVNGLPAEWMRVNGLLLGLALPAGSHELVMRYVPFHRFKRSKD